ncbi:MAG: hypothetical protein LQ346_008192 [Caloplaca aetnensis]|nr:MAG: hypothetical protein LQ346_008192 [Caloplaca aetnensis]
MRSFIASAALVAGVAATHGNGTAPVQYTTEIVTAYTTFCPAATQITHGAETYTVTEATTLTITNCPCTVTKPVMSTPVVYCSTCAPTSNAPVVPTSPAETHPVVPTTPVETHVTPITSVPTQAPVVPTTSAVETHVSSVSPVETPVTPVAPITTGTGSPAQPPVNQPIYGNSTVPAGPTGGAPGPVIPGTAAPSGTASPSGTTGNSPVPFQGAAPKLAASGASLAGLLGLAAFFL